MTSAFLEEIAKTLANNPKGLVSLLRTSSGTHRVVSAGRSAAVVGDRASQRAAAARQMAYVGSGRPGPALARQNLSEDVAASAARAKAPTQPQVRDLFAERGNEAVTAVRGQKAQRKRRIKFVATTGAAAVGSGGVVLGADAAFRGKKKERQVQV